MVVQHILAVRKGTREVTSLNKDEKNSASDSENEVDKTEDKSDEKVNEIITEKIDEKLEEKLDEKSDIKTEPTELEKKEEIAEQEIEKKEEIEQNIVDDINSSKKTIEIDEYYVKYRNFSYLHCEWKTEEELMKGDKRIAAKLKRFKQKMANNTNIFENVRLLLLYYCIKF